MERFYMEELRGREADCGQNPENRTVARTGFEVQGCPGSIQLFGCLLLSSVSQMGLPLSRVRSELQMTRPTCPELGSVWCICPGLSCKAVASWRQPYCVPCCSSPSQPLELTSVGEQVTQDHCTAYLASDSCSLRNCRCLIHVWNSLFSVFSLARRWQRQP